MRDAAITFAIRVAGATFALGQQLLLARLMTGAEYGAYVISVGWIVALGSHVSLGLGEAALRFVPRYAARGRVGRVAAFFGAGWRMAACTGAVASALLAVLIMALPLGGTALATAILIMAGLPPIALDYFLDGISRSMGWFRLGAFTLFVLRPLLIGAGCLFLHLGGHRLTLASAGAVTILSMAITTVVLLTIFARRLRPGTRPGESRRLAGLWLRSALPMLVVTGLEGLIPAAALLGVGLALGPAEAGIYGTAERLLSLAGFAQYAVLFVSGRLMSLALAGAGPDSAEASLQRATLNTLLATAAALALTLAVAPLLLKLFGAAFAQAYGPLCILSLALLARAMAAPCHEFLLIAGEHRALALINATCLLLMAGLMMVLAPPFGLSGAALATACSMALRAAMVLRHARTSMGISVLRPPWPPRPLPAEGEDQEHGGRRERLDGISSATP